MLVYFVPLKVAFVPPQDSFPGFETKPQVFWHGQGLDKAVMVIHAQEIELGLEPRFLDD